MGNLAGPQCCAVLSRVAAIIRAVLRRPDLAITTETNARQVPGWDSFAMVEMILQIQDEFGFELNDQELDRLGNVGDLVQFISAKDGVAGSKSRR